MKKTTLLFAIIAMAASCRKEPKKAAQISCKCSYHPTAIADTDVVYQVKDSTECQAREAALKAEYGHYGMNGTYCKW